MCTIGLYDILRGSNESLGASGEADVVIKAEPAGRRKSRPYCPEWPQICGVTRIFTPRPRNRDRAHSTRPATFFVLMAEQGRDGVERQIASWFSSTDAFLFVPRTERHPLHTWLCLLYLFFTLFLPCLFQAFTATIPKNICKNQDGITPKLPVLCLSWAARSGIVSVLCIYTSREGLGWGLFFVYMSLSATGGI